MNILISITLLLFCFGCHDNEVGSLAYNTTDIQFHESLPLDYLDFQDRDDLVVIEAEGQSPSWTLAAGARNTGGFIGMVLHEDLYSKMPRLTKRKVVVLNTALGGSFLERHIQGGDLWDRNSQAFLTLVDNAKRNNVKRILYYSFRFIGHSNAKRDYQGNGLSEEYWKELNETLTNQKDSMYGYNGLKRVYQVSNPSAGTERLNMVNTGAYNFAMDNGLQFVTVGDSILGHDLIHIKGTNQRYVARDILMHAKDNYVVIEI